MPAPVLDAHCDLEPRSSSHIFLVSPSLGAFNGRTMTKTLIAPLIALMLAGCAGVSALSLAMEGEERDRH